jgi:hypothetical protein
MVTTGKASTSKAKAHKVQTPGATPAPAADNAPASTIDDNAPAVIDDNAPVNDDANNSGDDTENAGDAPEPEAPAETQTAPAAAKPKASTSKAEPAKPTRNLRDSQDYQNTPAKDIDPTKITRPVLSRDGWVVPAVLPKEK